LNATNVNQYMGSGIRNSIGQTIGGMKQ